MGVVRRARAVVLACPCEPGSDLTVVPMRALAKGPQGSSGHTSAAAPESARGRREGHGCPQGHEGRVGDGDQPAGRPVEVERDEEQHRQSTAATSAATGPRPSRET